MPTIEQIFDKLCQLERRISDVRDGFALHSDTVADFFNTDTTEGHEIDNPRIDELRNTAISQGRAVMVDMTQGAGTLKTKQFQLGLDDIHTLSIKPMDEEVRCQMTIDTTKAESESHAVRLVMEAGSLSSNVEVVADNGQREYGAKLQRATVSCPFVRQYAFADGTLGSFWHIEKANVALSVISDGVANMMECSVSEPFYDCARPQYDFDRLGMIFWNDILLNQYTGITAALEHVSGPYIRMGVAVDMCSWVTGYLAMLETDDAGSWVRVYRVVDKVIVKVAEVASMTAWEPNTTYSVSAVMANEVLTIAIDGAQMLQVPMVSGSVEYLQQYYSIFVLDEYQNFSDPSSVFVATPVMRGENTTCENGKNGDVGVVVMATSTARCHALEVSGVSLPVMTVEEGVAATNELVVSNDISRWLEATVDTTILQGRIDLEYSTDGGVTFMQLGQMTFPEPSVRAFSLTDIPVIAGDNSIRFRVRMFDTGMTGWVHGVTVSYQGAQHPVFALDNAVIDNGAFALMPGVMSGSVTMLTDFDPQEIKRWERVVENAVRESRAVSIVSLKDLATITVDSVQNGHEASFAFDNDTETYWESLRSRDSYMMFEFADNVEVCGFRWVKKSLTEGAVYYRFQVLNETTGRYDDIHSYGYEVNDDIRHDLDAPVMGKKFRIYIDCVQPMSFGNARFVDLFGRTTSGTSNVRYEYSQDGGATFLSIGSDLSLSALNPDLPARFRAIMSRSELSLSVIIRNFGARFIGRDPEGTQLTDIKYDIQIGDRFLEDVTPNTEVDVRGVIGRGIQLRMRFLVDGQYLYERLSPSTSGYRMGVWASACQVELDALREQVEGVFRRADMDYDRDHLIDAMMDVIKSEIETRKIDGTAIEAELQLMLTDMKNDLLRLVACNRSVVVDNWDKTNPIPSVVMNNGAKLG